MILLGILTHLARTRPRFPLFTSSHDSLVSDPDVWEWSLGTRLEGVVKRNHDIKITSLSRAPHEKWQKEANLFLHEPLVQTRISTLAAITAVAQGL